MAPIVSVVIPTYNRPELLMDRAVRSVLEQTFADWECIVVGDGTDRHSVRAMLALCRRDDRFRFTNIPRSVLPDDPSLRWALAGIEPINYGLDQATGEFVSVLCDDDEFRPNNLAVLVRMARRYRADLAYGQSYTPDMALYGDKRKPDAFDIVQGAYILRRSLGYRADPTCVERGRSWDGDYMARILSGGHRVVRVPLVVHRFYPTPESVAISRAWA